VSILALSRGSFALDAATESIRVDYRADPGVGCPSAEEFVKQVFARIARARPAAEAEPGRIFNDELRRKGCKVTGNLVVEETAGTSVARQVSAAECGHVASVLALATALAIDPRAELMPRENAERAGSAVRPDVTSPAPAGPAPSSQAASRDTASAREAPESGGKRWSVRASLGAAVALGPAPQPSLGPFALLALRHDRAALEEVGLGFVFRTGASELVGRAKADFHFYAARPIVCLRGVELTASLQIAPCALVELGAVTGVGSEITMASRATRFWAAAAGLVRLQYSLSAEFFASLEAGAGLPLTRYRFVFLSPETSIHEVPLVTAEAGLRIGMRL
jgi:hypothetical protein